MTKTADKPLSALLPPVLAEDLNIKALAAAIDSVFVQIDGEVTLSQIARRLNDLPTPVYDLLAWQVVADFWQADMSREIKKAMLKTALANHREKGTPAFLRKMIAAVTGKQVAIKEWFEYGDDPFYFAIRLSINEGMLSAEENKLLFLTVEAWKNARSHLRRIEFVSLSHPVNVDVSIGCISRTRFVSKIAVSIPSTLKVIVGTAAVIHTVSLIKKKE